MSNDQISPLLFIVVSHIFVSVFCVYIGIQIGKLISINNNDIVTTQKKYNRKSKETNNFSPIQIDDKKIVVDIDTNKLTKKFDTLGEVTNSQDNISSSINKLKNMKG